MHPIHGIVRDALETDLTQMLEAGHDEHALRRELDKTAAADSTDALLELQEKWWSRPSPESFPYDEPSDWETISSHFPDAESHARFAGSDDELADRILAGWQGRCAGCQYLDICNGNFRVRAEAVHGDWWAPDPACYLTDEEIGLNGQ